MKQETLSWLASSRRFTQRFETRIGRMCRQMPLTEVAKLNGLSWDQVWRMELAYMHRLLAAHPPALHIRAIGVDEVSVKRGHSYRIVVADLDQRRPIWMGGDSRSEADMDRFFDELGSERSGEIALAVMDMWRPFRKCCGICPMLWIRCDARNTNASMTKNEHLLKGSAIRCYRTKPILTWKAAAR